MRSPSVVISKLPSEKNSCPSASTFPSSRICSPSTATSGESSGRRPVIVGGQRRAALDAVLAALDRATVVPPVAAPRGHRQVGLERAALDLVEDLVLQIREVSGAALRVRILGLEVRDDRGILFRAEPFVRVLDVVTVMTADDRVACGDGREGGCGVGGHPSHASRPDRPRGRVARATVRRPGPASGGGGGPRSGCRARRAATAVRAESVRRTRCAATRAATRCRSPRARPPPRR